MSRGVAQLNAIHLGRAGREAAQGGGRRSVSVLQILVFLWCQYLHVIRAVIFIAGLAEEVQLLVVFPFGHVEFVRSPAGQDRLIFTFKNCPKVLELALYIFNYKQTNRLCYIRQATKYTFQSHVQKLVFKWKTGKKSCYLLGSRCK